MKDIKPYRPPLPYPSLQPYFVAGISLIIPQGAQPTEQEVQDAYRLLDTIKALPVEDQERVAHHYFDPATFGPLVIPRIPYGTDLFNWLYSLHYFDQELVWQPLLPYLNESSTQHVIRHLINVGHPKAFEYCYQIPNEFIRQQIALAGYNTAYYLEYEENLEVLDALIEAGVNLDLAWQSDRKEVQLNLIHRYPDDPRLKQLVQSPHEAVRTTLVAKGLFLDQLTKDPSPDIGRIAQLRSVMQEVH